MLTIKEASFFWDTVYNLIPSFAVRSTFFSAMCSFHAHFLRHYFQTVDCVDKFAKFEQFVDDLQ